MIITEEYIYRHRTKRGAWTKAQILALGLEWPTTKGWIKSVVGKELSLDSAKKFERCNTKYAKRTTPASVADLSDEQLRAQFHEVLAEIKRGRIAL
jgi:hypothetical protein